MEKNLNNELRVFFQDKLSKKWHPVGVYSLHKFVGQENANKAILKALNSNLDNYSKKYRSFGTVKIYQK